MSMSFHYPVIFITATAHCHPCSLSLHDALPILKYANQGSFMPLDQLIEDFMPNFQAVMDRNEGVREAITFPDGKIYKLPQRSEEHTSELQSRGHLVCRLLVEKKKTRIQEEQHKE